jgi:hypothetical protein
MVTTAAALAFMVPAAHAADTQSDLVQVCVDTKGRLAPVRYVTDQQTCGN